MAITFKFPGGDVFEVPVADAMTYAHRDMLALLRRAEQEEDAEERLHLLGEAHALKKAIEYGQDLQAWQRVVEAERQVDRRRGGRKRAAQAKRQREAEDATCWPLLDAAFEEVEAQGYARIGWSRVLREARAAIALDDPRRPLLTRQRAERYMASRRQETATPE